MGSSPLHLPLQRRKRGMMDREMFPPLRAVISLQKKNAFGQIDWGHWMPLPLFRIKINSRVEEIERNVSPKFPFGWR